MISNVVHDIDVNMVILFGIAVSNAVGAYFAYRANENMKRLEKQTNSRLDLLVDTTKTGAHLAGREEQRQETAVDTNKMAAIIASQATVIAEKTAELLASKIK